ncbi:MAG: hypothetical protein EOR04_04990 [Mesorhizobium sp.]|uniref:hypothetical protein n=1 Tax=Mesorhizobium sp. TaxID=1871066 RepID=UPI000FE8A8CE|nr:hypothetical protein [Mesorhizobium sp.]RWP44278.1 MAG: hypothetical protein EOR04_04990 [Mesorhizobium sp.]
MRKLISLAALCAAVSCGPALAGPKPLPSPWKLYLADDIKSTLKDPYSVRGAQLSDPFIYRGKWAVCVAYNAKNSFGGYVGAKPYMYTFTGSISGWKMVYGWYAKDCAKRYNPFPRLG